MAEGHDASTFKKDHCVIFVYIIIIIDFANKKPVHVSKKGMLYHYGELYET